MFKHNGILNISASCKDFYSEYTLIIKDKVYGYQSLNGTLKYGLLLYGENYGAINIPVGTCGYNNLIQMLKNSTNEVSNVYNLLLMSYELSNTEIVLAFIKDRKEDYFESYILTKKDDEYVLLKMKISDIVCLTNVFQFPIYINTKMYDKYKFSTFGVIVEEEEKLKVSEKVKSED